ncbi:unnamed protein product [Heterobilharzia americana]|nr:unnamed protein product [Heterobilharzia americana]
MFAPNWTIANNLGIASVLKIMVFMHMGQAFVNSLQKKCEENQNKWDKIVFPICGSELDFASIFHDDEWASVDYFFYLWSLFNTTPVDCDTISIGSVRVEKDYLLHHFSQLKCCHIWFTENHPQIDYRNITSLILFLEAFVQHIFAQPSLEVHYMESLSCLILLSWWNIAFGHSQSYQIIARELYSLWVRLIPQLVEKSSLTITQLSAYPEHLNLFIINLLRVYVDCHRKDYVSKTIKDPASQMIGIHASVNMHSLGGLYRKTVEHLQANKEKDFTFADTPNHDFSTTFSLADCLKQNPDLPIIAFTDPQIVERLNVVRDYLLVRACRVIAYELEPTSTNIHHLSKQLTCLVHVTAPKNIVLELLSISLRKPEKSSTFGSAHISLISWVLEQNLNVTDYAFWCVSSVEMKDMEAANVLFPRLFRHAKLLAKDHLFCYSLILQLDRVRKATLPEKEHLKLLRAVFEHLSVSSKCELLKSLQSSKNCNRATPLSNSNVHFQSRVRQIFNRLVVYNSDSSDDNQHISNHLTKRNNTLADYKQLAAKFGNCELLLFTHPIRFLTELIRLPVNRNCSYSQTAVHQLLDQLSYVFQVPTDFSTVSKLVNESNGRKLHQHLNNLRKSFSDISLFGEDPCKTDGDTLFSVTFEYDEEKCSIDDLCEFNASRGSNYELSDNFILDTVVHLFKQPNCFIQINNIVQCFLNHLERNFTNHSSDFDHLITLPTTKTSATTTTAMTVTTTSESIPLRCIHIRIIISVFYFLMKDASILTVLNQINLNESIEQFVKLFKLLFLDQVNGNTLRKQSSNDDDVDDKMCSKTVVIVPAQYRQYLISNEVDIMLLELIEYCFQQSLSSSYHHPHQEQMEETEHDEKEQEYRHPVNGVENTLRLLYTLRSDIDNSINVCSWYKQRCLYLFVSTLSSVNSLKSKLLELSIEVSDIQLKTLKQLIDIDEFYKTTVSNKLCSEVLKAVIKNSTKSSQLWSISGISTGHLLIAFHLFLRKVVKTKQLKCWERLYFLLGRLMKFSILVYPVTTFVNANEEVIDGLPPRLFYLMDWSKLCGSFDVFALTSDLLNLWCTSSSTSLSNQRFNSAQCASMMTTTPENEEKLQCLSEEFYVLCHSLCDLVSNLTSVCVKPSHTEFDTNNSNNDGKTGKDDSSNVNKSVALKAYQFTQYTEQLAKNLLGQLSRRLNSNLISSLKMRSSPQFNVASELNRLERTISWFRQNLNRKEIIQKSDDRNML